MTSLNASVLYDLTQTGHCLKVSYLEVVSLSDVVLFYQCLRNRLLHPHSYLLFQNQTNHAYLSSMKPAQNFPHLWKAFEMVIMENLLLSILKPSPRTCSLADLGPVVFQVNGKTVYRMDEVVEQVPFSYYQLNEDRPSVLYLHSYNSNRVESLTLLHLLLENNFNVATIEMQRIRFNPQQQKAEITSEGLVSFGHYECQQVVSVMKWIRERRDGKVYLWGRSMGAVTALLYQSKYSGADGLVLDSPFHSLHDIFVSQFASLTKLPRVMGEGVMLVASVTFKSLLGFSLSELDILEQLSIKCPAFIIANPKDSLAGPSSLLIYAKCRGERKILYSEAEHSASRQLPILTEIISHLNKLQRSSRKLLSVRSMQRLGDYEEKAKTEANEPKPKEKRKVFLKLMQVRSSKNIKETKH